VGSFNKILFPALRIAFAIVPECLVGAFVDAKHVADGHTAMLTQGVLAAFIQEGHLARHLRKTRAIYDERPRRRAARLGGRAARNHDVPGLR
jgi:GntR family transcriptional regulator/MocR family aminotransferase